MQDSENNILLIGYGRYGEKIARFFNKENLYIVEINEKNLQRARHDKFEKIFLIEVGDDETLLQILSQKKFDYIFCALDNEEENVFFTITIKTFEKNIKIIAICESKESERKLKLAGADKVIDTMEGSASKIFHLIEKPAVMEAIEEILFEDEDIDIREVEIPKNSFLEGKYIKDIDLKKDYNLILIGIIDKERGNNFVFITKGINHKIDAEDILLIIGYKEDIKRFIRDLKERE
ncbi:MAG: TrkA family potassium uptake protein [Epsilonproteobacteria bacterium]|nr:TrkA family potassium uptake protein [Campylobacterota bacterium]